MKKREKLKTKPTRAVKRKRKITRNSHQLVKKIKKTKTDVLDCVEKN